jgi:hypothetical protein
MANLDPDGSSCQLRQASAEADPALAAHPTQRFSWWRVLKLSGCFLSMAWFYLILFGFPSIAPQHPRAGRGTMTVITIAAVLTILLSLRGWRMHVLALPLWLATLYWLFYMWFAWYP